MVSPFRAPFFLFSPQFGVHPLFLAGPAHPAACFSKRLLGLSERAVPFPLVSPPPISVRGPHFFFRRFLSPSQPPFGRFGFFPFYSFVDFPLPVIFPPPGRNTLLAPLGTILPWAFYGLPAVSGCVTPSFFLFWDPPPLSLPPLPPFRYWDRNAPRLTNPTRYLLRLLFFPPSLLFDDSVRFEPTKESYSLGRTKLGVPPPFFFPASTRMAEVIGIGIEICFFATCSPPPSFFSPVVPGPSFSCARFRATSRTFRSGPPPSFSPPHFFLPCLRDYTPDPFSIFFAAPFPFFFSSRRRARTFSLFFFFSYERTHSFSSSVLHLGTSTMSLFFPLQAIYPALLFCPPSVLKPPLFDASTLDELDYRTFFSLGRLLSFPFFRARRSEPPVSSKSSFS